MTTAPPTLVWLQDQLVANLSTSNLGIIGDAAHVKTGGYHIGAASLRAAGMSDDYSLRYSEDRDATHDYACAVDIGGSGDTLMVLGNRIVAALRAHDPRVYNKVRGVNAPFDGDSTDRRYDTHDPGVSDDTNVQASSDRNHIHLEVYRTLILDQSVVQGVFDVLSGKPLTPPPPPVVKPQPVPDPMEEIMSYYKSKDEFEAAMTSLIREQLVAFNWLPGDDPTGKVRTTHQNWSAAQVGAEAALNAKLPVIVAAVTKAAKA